LKKKEEAAEKKTAEISAFAADTHVKKKKKTDLSSFKPT
jgi:hypothetical protein